jgi:hypothetical protein
LVFLLSNLRYTDTWVSNTKGSEGLQCSDVLLVLFYRFVYGCMFCILLFNSVSYVFLLTSMLCSVYRVIRKSLRNFRPLRYSNRGGHAEGEHVNRRTDTPSFCSTLQVLDMSTLGDAADVKFGNFGRFKDTKRFLIPGPRHVSSWLPPSGETCKYATEPSTTPPPPKKKTWRDFLPIDVLLSAVSVLVVVQPISEVPEGLINYPVLFANWHSPATMTEGFPCLFLSCKTNARVYLAKTGRGSALLLISELCCSMYCLCRLCCSMYCLCVNVYCTTATLCQPNCS